MKGGKRTGYLVILDEDAEDHHSPSRWDGDVPLVWTEVLQGRVRASRDLTVYKTQHNAIMTVLE